jgi:two-component system sensor histidine kinase/response regulator
VTDLSDSQSRSPSRSPSRSQSSSQASTSTRAALDSSTTEHQIVDKQLNNLEHNHHRLLVQMFAGGALLAIIIFLFVSTFFIRERDPILLGGVLLFITLAVVMLGRSFFRLFTRMDGALREQTLLAGKNEQANQKLSAIFNSVADAFITVTLTGKITSVNHTALPMFGYEEHELLGQSIKSLLPDLLTKSRTTETDNVYLTTEFIASLGQRKELQALRQSGDTFPVHLAIFEINSEQSTIFTCIIRDISSEKQQVLLRVHKENEIKIINERMALATSVAKIGIWEFDFPEQSSVWDHRMYQLFGLNPDDFIDKEVDWRPLVHPDDSEEVEQRLRLSILQRNDLDLEYRIKLPDGEIKHLKVFGVIKCDRQGNPAKMVGINYDITKIKTAELAHLAAKELAETSVRHKTEFLATMSHEIRTPLNGVLGMLGLLTRGELSDEQQHRAELATSSAESLLTLIHDILDFSKVEAGKLSLEIVDFDLCHLFEEFTQTMAHKAQQKGIELVLDISGINHCNVKGDPGRVRQVLTNIVGNAIKFTAQGEIVIRAEISQCNNLKVKLNCAISDTGIGIAKDKSDDLFDLFTQVDASTTRKFGGTGLGLAISKQLCELMQGDIQMQSKPGQGSIFSFNLDLDSSEKHSALSPADVIKGLALLVVDDNQANAAALTRQLAFWGAKVSQADSALSALTFLTSPAGKACKLALIDQQMPAVNGFALIEKIRALPDRSDLKLVLMTAACAADETHLSTAHGIDANFSKPATPSALLAALSLALGKNKKMATKTSQTLDLPAPVCQPETNAESLKHCRLLLVEDNRINQQVARQLLLSFGTQVDIAANGLEALSALNMSQTDIPYDIILMDCQMPEMDGYQASTQIREGRGGTNYMDVPIIAMTANAMKGDREKCLDAGMSDYLSKPIDIKLLKEKLVFWHQCDRSVTNLPDNASEQIWDKAKLLKRVSQNNDILLQLIKLFVDQTPLSMSALSTAFEQEDSEQMLSQINVIQEITANVNADQLLHQLKVLRELIDEDAMTEAAYQQLLLSYQRVLALFEEILLSQH